MSVVQTIPCFDMKRNDEEASRNDATEQRKAASLRCLYPSDRVEPDCGERELKIS